ncbi:MAG: hypothetical protein ABI831_02450 [Betaproteobacteria bacterium]
MRRHWHGLAACGKTVGKFWTTFLQLTIAMILLAFFCVVPVQKNICRGPLPTYNE